MGNRIVTFLHVYTPTVQRKEQRNTAEGCKRVSKCKMQKQRPWRGGNDQDKYKLNRLACHRYANDYLPSVRQRDCSWVNLIVHMYVLPEIQAHKIFCVATYLPYLALWSTLSPLDNLLLRLLCSKEVLSLLERSVGMEGFVKIAETDFDVPFTRSGLSVLANLLSKESLALSPIKQSWCIPFFLHIFINSPSFSEDSSPSIVPLSLMHPTAAILHTTIPHDVRKTCADFLSKMCHVTPIKGVFPTWRLRNTLGEISCNASTVYKTKVTLFGNFCVDLLSFATRSVFFTHFDGTRRWTQSECANFKRNYSSSRRHGSKQTWHVFYCFRHIVFFH